EKQRLLRLLVEEIIFEGDRIRIRGIIPLIPDGELDQAEIRETFRQGDSAEQEPTSDMSPVMSPQSRIADMTPYHHGRNPAGYVCFELRTPLPGTGPLFTDDDLRFIRRLAKDHPRLTLKEMCDRLRQERSVAVSITSISRALIRMGLSHKVRRSITIAA